MAGVTVKMGVDVSQFKQGMQQAQQSVKTLDAQLKLNEKQLKANGDAELYMSNKAKLLDQQLAAQQKVVSGLYKQLDEMKKRGVDETSEAYQKLERSIYNAAGKMMDIQAEINSLTASEQKAAAGASSMEQNLSSINKKVSFDAVLKGVNSITSGLEKAAQTAIKVGEKIWDNIMDSAAYADDTATLATRMGLTIEEVQQMQYVAKRFEAPVETVAKVWKKLKVNMASDSDEVQEAFAQLGVSLRDVTGYGIYGDAIGAMKDYRDVFWETGEALMNMTDESERERLAQKLLGRSWDEMAVMFDKGRDAYEAAMKEAPTNSEEAINNAAELNDRVAELEQSFKVLKTEVIGNIAPALSDAAKILQGLMDSITEYLKTDEGQAMLQRLGEAVSGLFEDLKNIDPEDVVDNFVTLFTKLTDSFEWISKNWDSVKTGLYAIVGVITAGKAVSAATTFLNLINGLKSFGGGSGTPDVTTTETGGGAPVKPTANAAKKIANLAKKGLEYAAPVLEVGGIALGVYELTYGSMERAMEAWNEDAAKRVAELDRQESSFTGSSDVELVAAWKEIREHANDDGFLDELARRYYKFDKSADVNSEYWDYEDAFWDPLFSAYNEGQIKDETWDSLTEMMGKIIRKQEMQKQGWTGGWETLDLMDTMNLLNQVEAELAEAANAEPPEVQVDPVVPDNAAEILAAQIGTVTVPANVVPREAEGEYANGLFSVPWDGYPAILHKGERVLPASEAQRYTYNTYFGNVNLHNGLEVDALAESIERNSRRKRAGYGAA